MRLISSLLIILCLSCPVLAGEPLLMRYRYEGIQDWILTYQITTEISTSGNPTEVKVDGREKVTVTPLPGGHLRYVSRCERCVVTSEQSITPNQLGVLAAGDVFDVEMDDRGVIINVISTPQLARNYPFVSPLPEEAMTLGVPIRDRGSIHIPDVGLLEINGETKITRVQGDQIWMQGVNRLRWKKDRREGKTEYKSIYDRRIGVILRGKLKTIIEGEVNGHRFEQSVFFNWDLRPAGNRSTSEENW